MINGNQKVIMSDGSIRKIRELKVGDMLMGVDSKPKKLLNLNIAKENVYEIIPIKGDSFVVGEGQMLNLKMTGLKTKKRDEHNRRINKKGEISKISVSEYLNKSGYFKHIHKLYRTDIEFAEKELPIDPYLLGVLIGDGSICNNRISITTPDNEIVSEIYRFAKKYDLCVRKETKSNNKASSYYYHKGKKGNQLFNYLKDKLIHLGLMETRSGDKFIPHIYKTSSRSQRLSLLSGLIDTDGSSDPDKSSLEYSTKSKQLNDDILYLARSLGFSAYSSEKIVKGSTYYRMNINGNTDSIPSKVKRKQAIPRKQKKNVLVTGFKIDYIGNEEYTHFELDGDSAYLLDSFTVAHN